MRMTIAVVGKDGHPVDGPSAEFDEDGGTIGRRVDCTLVIADEQRHISRVHALVEFRGDYFCIVDKGSYIPVRVNGLRVGRGQETPIFEGDEIVIGGYAMRVVHVAAAWDLDATVAVPALTIPVSPRRAVAVSEPAVPPETGTQADPPAASAVPPRADAANVSDSADASSDGDKGRRRKPRSRRKPAPPESLEVPLEAIRDNPTATHEPGRTLPPEESVARLLAAEAGPVIPDFDVSAEGGIPGASISDRPGQSTFDLLADRLLEKGDLAYDPFMPSVWDERNRPPASMTSGPEQPARQPAAFSEDVPEGALQPPAPRPLPDTETPEHADSPPEAADAIVMPTCLEEMPESGPPVALTAELGEPPTVIEAALGESLATAASCSEAGPVALDGEGVSDDDAESDGASAAPQGMTPTVDVGVGLYAGAGAIPDAEVLARVVRRRHRGPAGRPETPAEASCTPSPIDADRPEIVLVLQPLAAGEEGSLVVPIRRRNRRTPQLAAH